MATLNCDIGTKSASYGNCRRGNKVILVLLYNLCILLVLPCIVKQVRFFCLISMQTRDSFIEMTNFDLITKYLQKSNDSKSFLIVPFFAYLYVKG